MTRSGAVLALLLLQIAFAGCGGAEATWTVEGVEKDYDQQVAAKTLADDDVTYKLASTHCILKSGEAGHSGVLTCLLTYDDGDTGGAEIVVDKSGDWISTET